jgi:hypothetical protein
MYGVHGSSVCGGGLVERGLLAAVGLGLDRAGLAAALEQAVYLGACPRIRLSPT